MTIGSDGRSGAEALWDQVRVGTFRMKTDTAVRCARHYQDFGDSLQRYLIEAAGLRRSEEFGEFASAQQLQAGFAGKADALHGTLLTIQESAYRMAEAYLRAGGAIEEADRVNALAISRMNQ